VRRLGEILFVGCRVYVRSLEWNGLVATHGVSREETLR
jgi:hypothetical protein